SHERGPVEAPRSSASRSATSALRALTSAAPLKPRGCLSTPVWSAPLRALTSAAPLKRQRRPADRDRQPALRALTSAAPLKQLRALVGEVCREHSALSRARPR